MCQEEEGLGRRGRRKGGEEYGRSERGLEGEVRKYCISSTYTSCRAVARKRDERKVTLYYKPLIL